LVVHGQIEGFKNQTQLFLVLFISFD